MLEEDNAAGYAAQDVQTMKDRGWSQYKDGTCVVAVVNARLLSNVASGVSFVPVHEP